MNRQSRNLGITTIILVFLTAVALPASACSVTACLDRGIEMRGDFAVKIKHADKPLPGAGHASGESVNLDLTFTVF
jgi:hypothetical protein